MPTAAAAPSTHRNGHDSHNLNSSHLLDEVWNRFQQHFRKSPSPKEFLQQQGLTPRDDSLFELGYCPKDFGTRFGQKEKDALRELGLLDNNDCSRFACCLVFPLRSARGELVGLQGEAMGSGDSIAAVLRNTPRGVFGYHAASSETTYLVASPLDVLSLRLLGAPSALALYGKHTLCEDHVEWLRKHLIQNVTLVPSGNARSRETAAKAMEKLKPLSLRLHLAELPEGKTLVRYLCPLDTDKPRPTLEAFRTLPGHPTAPLKPRLEKLQDEFVIRFPKRHYRARLLSNASGASLRLSLRCNAVDYPERFHVDTLDLHASRARRHFAEETSEELRVPDSEIAEELKSLLTLLERELPKAESTENAKPTLTDAQKNEALQALRDPNLMDMLLKAFETTGLIGEEKAKLLGYLAGISRLLEAPLGVLIVSRSGAGKTALQDAICSFVPEEDLVRYTRLTGQALFYKGREDLKHKVLAIEEEDGMQQALYAIRTLQSSQRLTVAATRSDPKSGKLKTEEYVCEGPVSILISTTNPDALDTETRSRFVILTVDESPEQTRRILTARAAQFTTQGRLRQAQGEHLRKLYHNMQRCLRPLVVVNDLAPYLDYPFQRLQMRREFGKYMALINSIALLHQHQREVKRAKIESREVEYIEATVEDVARANELARAFFPNSTDDLAPHTRRLAEYIVKLIAKKQGEARFTKKELRDFCNWTDWSLRQGLDQLTTLGYVAKVGGHNGVALIYELLCDPAEEQREGLLLTEPEELARRIEAAKRKRRT